MNFRIKLLLSFIFSIIFGVVIIFFTPLFKLQDINCNLDYQPCHNQQIISELAKYRYRNLLTLPLDVIKSRLLSGEYTLRAVEFNRSYPHTLEVNLFSTYPVIAISVANNPTQWLALDMRYRIITLTERDPNVVTLIVHNLPKFQLGQTISDSTLLKQLELTLNLSQQLVSLKSVEFKSQTEVWLHLNQDLIVVISPSNFLDKQLINLQTILSQPDLLKSYSTIDLRFSKPILK